MTTLDNFTKMKIKFDLPETNLAFLKKNLSFEATSDVIKGKIFKGNIDYIDSRIDEQSRTIRVYAILNNTDNVLRPGLFMKIKLVLQEKENAFLIPEEALLSINGTWWGSLNQFHPGKGYWFIVNDYTPFQYNTPSLSSNINHPDELLRDDEILEFNQSTLQSVFFIEKIYLSGNINEEAIELKAICHNNIVGQSTWNEEFSDLIAMGNDGFSYTDNYCSDNEKINIEYNQNTFYILNGNNSWQSNNFEILTLSDCDYGDLNFNHYLNISDIILLIEHITSISLLSNDHQIILADVNQDYSINVTDIIIIVDQILNN